MSNYGQLLTFTIWMMFAEQWD